MQRLPLPADPLQARLLDAFRSLPLEQQQFVTGMLETLAAKELQAMKRPSAAIIQLHR